MTGSNLSLDPSRIEQERVSPCTHADDTAQPTCRLFPPTVRANRRAYFNEREVSEWRAIVECLPHDFLRESLALLTCYVSIAVQSGDVADLPGLIHRTVTAIWRIYFHPSPDRCTTWNSEEEPEQAHHRAAEGRPRPSPSSDRAVSMGY